MNITKGNLLIAQFMDNWTDTGQEPAFYVYKHKGYESHELQFHKSWDWLMPVVDKMEEVTKCRVGNIHIGIGGSLYSSIIWNYDQKTKTFNSYTGKAHIHLVYYDELYKKDKKIDQQANSKIESVWKCCIHFIKWYNNEQKKIY